MTPVRDQDLADTFEQAIERGELRMLYQPNVGLADGKLTRLEALVRWTRPGEGPVEPSRFVAVAEQHGLIGPLTEWGLRTTLEQWRKWRSDGLDTQLAFNISPLSLSSLDFPDLVERICHELDVPIDRLVLELTEGATQQLIKLMDTLTRFRIKGIGLAIDDFGTGYSSLMQLRQLPFTEIKIDRLFVKDLPAAHDSCVIVKSMVDLAHGLGLTATAEGVETIEQLRFLRSIRCDVGQGYLIAQPLEPLAVASWKRDFERKWGELSAG
jgi:EAL domain-containing protein (putative c-di-GMP-specific phosphodiesterase class I)